VEFRLAAIHLLRERFERRRLLAWGGGVLVSILESRLKNPGAAASLRNELLGILRDEPLRAPSRASDEDRRKYLELLGTKKGFKSLDHIVAAMRAVNKAVLDADPHA
jgi:hypothetical protein